jgi:nucleoid DNA-binding protein
MTKAEFINEIWTELDKQNVLITKVVLEKVINTTYDTIKDKLSKGIEVSLTGVGIFKTVQRKERAGRNPRTGEAIKIPAYTGIKFTSAKALKDAVRG